MPQMSAYPPTQDVMPQAAGPQAPAMPQAPMAGPQGAPQEAPQGDPAALRMMNPIMQAMQLIGITIQSAKQSGVPNAQRMSTAFSGLLKEMATPSLQRGSFNAQAPAAPGAPQPAPAAPQAPAPVAQAPAPQPQAAPVPAPAAPKPMTQTPMGAGKNIKPFGQSQGQRPVSKQPVIL